MSYGLLALALAIIVPLTATGRYEPNVERGLIFGAIALAAIGIGRVVVFLSAADASGSACVSREGSLYMSPN